MEEHKRGYDDMFNDGALRGQRTVSARSRPAAWPKSTSEMRKHVSYGSQGIAGLSDGDRHHEFKMRTGGQGSKIRTANTYVRPDRARIASRVALASRAPVQYTTRVPPTVDLQTLAALRNLRWKRTMRAEHAAEAKAQIARLAARLQAEEKRRLLMDGRQWNWGGSSSA